MMTALYTDPIAIDHALAGLGLDEQSLLDAAMHGYLARSNCTANHPPLYPSFVAWGETVRVLRERLATKGWVRSDEKNYSRTLHPEGHIAIAVATGNEATGVASDSPLTKSAKGPSTIEAIEVNRLQAWLPGMEPPDASGGEDESQPTTWLLLIHHASNEIRCELSQPFEIGTDGRINGWRERIILRSMSLDNEPLTITPPSQPDLNVEIRRKA